MGTQPHSKDLTSVEQGHLALVRTPQQTELSADSIAKQKTLLGAINLCITESALEDKEIYLALEIDAGHFSNLRKGNGHFPTNKIEALMDLCGNEIPLIWLANKRGYALMLIVSEAERKLKEGEAREAKLQEQVEFLTKLIQGKAAL